VTPVLRMASVALLAVLAVTVVAGPVAAQQGEPPATPSPPSADQTASPEPSPFDIGGRMRSAISGRFSDLVASALEPVFDLLGRTVFSTPPLSDHPRIRDLWRFSLGVADALLLIMVLAGAGMVTVNGGIGVQLTAKELIPRVLLAAAVANLSLLLLGVAISFSNALARGMLGSIDADAVAKKMTETLFGGGFINPFYAILALALVVLGLLVVVAYVLRIAILVVLASAAPLMLIGHALPQSENWARLWWRAITASLVAPVAQALLLSMAFRIFLSDDGLLGLGGGGVIDLLVIGCILYLLFKIPFWALNAALGGAGSSAWATTKRYAGVAAKAVVA